MSLCRRPIAPIALAALLLSGCGDAGEPTGRAAESPASAGSRADVHSHARPDLVGVTHMRMDWTVLFEEKALDGQVLLSLERRGGASGAGDEPLRLDTRDLEISNVFTGTAANGEGAARLTQADWRLGEPDEILGSELMVDLPAGADLVRIDYRTKPGATGLQWLAPAQTAAGSGPFLYSQSQAIHARSWIPCQDSPAVRVTFEATVRVPPGMTAVMAAPSAGGGDGVFTFTMDHPIPSYLIALAVGDLSFGEIGPRTGVWAEAPVLEAARAEFGDMEKMLETAEALYGRYRWGRYDLLVLPPSFPFGGMENPTLTFLTPTVLAGDRSLVSLVAHEMAHSWSGNLVTNATWSDFWLNEGFTSYIERRIMEAVYGEERARMEWMLGRRDLEEEVASLADAPGDQLLEVDLRGRDPDDGMNDIPYEKGAHLLRRLEETYGREAFDDFLHSWFDAHAFSSVTTEIFTDYLKTELIDAREPLDGHRPPDLDVWIRQPGIPGDLPRVASDALARVDAQRARWLAGTAPPARLVTAGWTTHHWLHFLRGMPESLDAPAMEDLDEAFGFTATTNSEILDVWLVLACRHGYEPAYPRLERFLTSQGRRKFLEPLYEELVKTDEGRRRARRIYTQARPLYHSISRRTLDPIVGYP